MTSRAVNTESAFLSREDAYDLDRWHWRPDTPADTVCIGAILVQHTSWVNVENALARLQAAGIDRVEALESVSDEALALLVRPAGMPRTRARRLKAFATLAARRGGLDALLSLPLAELRSLLLATPGIGPETADCICLYAACQPALVHDAYTERLLGRLGLGPGRGGYAAWQGWLMGRLPPDTRVYQRFHAAVVVHCKETCRARPACGSCPLLDLCPFGRSG